MIRIRTKEGNPRWTRIR